VIHLGFIVGHIPMGRKASHRESRFQRTAKLFQRGFTRRALNSRRSFGSDRFRRAIFFRQGFNGLWGEELALFQQSAEIFFAGMTMFAFVGGETFEDLITHFQAFQVDDADIFAAVFPDLSLLKFERHGILRSVSPILIFGETAEGRSYFFLPAACLLNTAAFFLAVEALALDCFWPDFFWFDFGDLSPMMFIFRFTAVDSPAE
jgi:hypothetical protein